MGETKTEIGESVKVVASFAPKKAVEHKFSEFVTQNCGVKIGIHFFSWRNRVYKVDSANLFHIEKDFGKKYYHFAVSADGNSYQLAFDPTTLSWELRDVVSV